MKMANFFKRKGTGKDTGKLLFRSLEGIFPVTITASGTDLTITDLSNGNPNILIPNKYIVIGNYPNSPGITYSNLWISDDPQQEGIYGVNNINGSVYSCANSNSFSIFSNGLICENSGNSVAINSSNVLFSDGTIRNVTILNRNSVSNNGSCYDLHLNSRGSYFKGGCSSISISSLYPKVFYSIYSTIISTKGSCIVGNAGYGTYHANTILSSGTSTISGSILSRNSIISGVCGIISNVGTNTYTLRNNSIISSKCICIHQTSQPDVNSNFIASTYYTRITNSNKSTVVSSYSKINTIDSGEKNSIFSSKDVCAKYSELTSILASYGSSFWSNGNSKIYNSAIISDYCSDFSLMTGSSSNNTLISNTKAKIIGTSSNNVMISNKNSYSYTTNSVMISNQFTCNILQDSKIIFDSEKKAFKTSISGSGNKNSFISIAGKDNCSYSLTMALNGCLNRVGLKSSRSYNQATKGLSFSECRSTPDTSIIIGGQCNIASSNESSIIISSRCTELVNTRYSGIISSNSSFICSTGCYGYYTGGTYNYATRSDTISSFIISSGGSSFRSQGKTADINENYVGPWIYASGNIKTSGIIGSKFSRIFSDNSWCNSSGGTSSPSPIISQIITGTCEKSNSGCGCNLSFGVCPTSIYNYSLTVQKLIVNRGFFSGTFSSTGTRTICQGVTGVWSNPKWICVVNGIVTCVSTTP